MASTATSSLKVEKQGSADNPGTWDTHLNVGLDILDSAIAGTTEISTTGGSTTLTDVDYTDDEAKKAVLDVTGALTTNATIVIPNRSRLFRVFNRTTEGGSNTTLTIKTSGGSGITVTRDSVALVYCDGNDVVRYAGTQAGIATGGVTGVLTASDIGTTVQAWDTQLDSLSSASANGVSLVQAANYAAMKALLDLEIGTDVQAYNANLTTYAGIAPSANVQSVLGAADYSAIRTLLGLVIGTNVQAYDAELAALAGTTSAADKVPYYTGAGTASTADFTAAGRAMVGAADAAAQTALLSTFVGDSGSGGAKGLVPATVAGDSTKFLRGDATFVAIPGGGDALTSGNLSQFAATTSAQLRGVLSDETGTGFAYFQGGDIGTPSAGVLTNATGYPFASIEKSGGGAPSANVQSIVAAADYSAIRTLLGLVIGTNVQAYDADLTTWAGLTPSANAQSLVTAADYSAMRTLLGLVIGTNVQAYDADLTTWAGITPGTGVATALAVNVGSSGAFVTFNGALGTPSSGTLSSCTAATTSARGVSELATTAEYQAGTSTDRVLVVDQVWGAGALTTLNDSGGNIAVDMSTGINFSMTMDGDYTLSNPTNTKVGQTGMFVFTQDGTGTQTLAYGTSYEFAGGVAFTLSTAASTKDAIFYAVQSSTSILLTGILRAVA
jgi:hypothetical protein